MLLIWRYSVLGNQARSYLLRYGVQVHANIKLTGCLALTLHLYMLRNWACLFQEILFCVLLLFVLGPLHLY